MPRLQSLRRLGISVRIRVLDQADYRLLASALGDIPVARLLVLLILEVALILAKREAPPLSFGSLIVAIQRNKALSAVCRRILDRGGNSEENGRSQALWLGFKDSERESLNEIWRALQWSEGKLMLACLHDAMMLGSMESAATEAPVVPTLYRAIRRSQAGVVAEVLSEINPVLESARRERKRGQPPAEVKSFATEPPLNRSLKETDWIRRDHNTLFTLGQKNEGGPLTVDFSSSASCNGLIVGGSGSGKTELLKSIVLSLMSRNDPSSLRFAFFDPQPGNFHDLNGSPFLLRPVITNVAEAIRFLESTVQQIDHRYQLIPQNVGPSREEIWSPRTYGLPVQVLIFDNFDALLGANSQLKNALEGLLIRVAATGRAVGIHLLAAAQRAGNEFVAGSIKANLPLRICLKVASAAESSVFLGVPGAEVLRGQGALLCDAGSGIVNAHFSVISPEEFIRISYPLGDSS